MFILNLCFALSLVYRMVVLGKLNALVKNWIIDVSLSKVSFMLFNIPYQCSTVFSFCCGNHSHEKWKCWNWLQVVFVEIVYLQMHRQAKISLDNGVLQTLKHCFIALVNFWFCNYIEISGCSRIHFSFSFVWFLLVNVNMLLLVLLV